MKTHKITVVLLILLAGYTYADSRVRGYETEDCSGSYLEAGSYSELKEWHNQTDSFGNTWHFESFIYVKDEDKCHDFDMPTVVVKGTRLPDDSYDVDDTNGDAGRGGGFGGISHNYPNEKNPADDFNLEDFDKSMDCLLDNLVASNFPEEWEGEHTKAKYADRSVRKEKWGIGIDPNELRFGGILYHPKDWWNVTNANDLQITMFIDRHRIGIEYLDRKPKVPFDHLVLYWQMHEFIHVLQAVHERDDGDDQFVPYNSNSFLREMEVHNTLWEWWPKLFGVDAPYKVPTQKQHKDWDKRAKEFEALIEKRKNGTFEESDDENDETDKTSDEKAWDKLIDYFKKHYPSAKWNNSYDRKNANIDCDDE